MNVMQAFQNLSRGGYPLQGVGSLDTVEPLIQGSYALQPQGLLQPAQWVKLPVPVPPGVYMFLGLGLAFLIATPMPAGNYELVMQ